MRPATESALKSSSRWLVVSAGLALGGSLVGCSWVKEFRNGDEPVLGPAAHPSAAAAKPAKGGDLYAQSFNRGRSQALLAQREADARAADPADPGAESDLTLPSSDQPSRGPARSNSTVALQPPVTLPASREPAPKESRPTLASAAAGPSWQPRESSGMEPPADSSPASRVGSPSRPQKATLESILAESRARLDSFTTYQVLLTGQERVGGQLQPAEDVLVSIRRDPKAVRLEWKGGPHKGREVIYSAAENQGLMHVNMADSVLPVPRVAIPPDSPLALRNSRHPITEAGFETILANMEQAARGGKAGDPPAGKVTYEGMEQPDGLEHPCHKFVRVTPAGETWLVYIDPRSQLPALVQATDSGGELLERYLFRNPTPNVAELAQADAFDVNQRWGEAKGLFSRLARSGAAGPRTTANSATR